MILVIVVIYIYILYKDKFEIYWFIDFILDSMEYLKYLINMFWKYDKIILEILVGK